MTKNEDDLNQNATQKPKSKAGRIFLIIALVIGAIFLFLYWYVMGLASGFSNS